MNDDETQMIDKLKLGSNVLFILFLFLCYFLFSLFFKSMVEFSAENETTSDETMYMVEL